MEKHFFLEASAGTWGEEGGVWSLFYTALFAMHIKYDHGCQSPASTPGGGGGAGVEHKLLGLEAWYETQKHAVMVNRGR